MKELEKTIIEAKKEDSSLLTSVNNYWNNSLLG